MRYFLVVGEASGDLHAAHLMREIKVRDAAAEFQFFGGDLMSAEGGECLCHYRDLAFMGFLPVLLHFPTILRGLKRCKEAIRTWQPHCVILVDYPGFNLKIARFVKEQALCPVFYYISPKIWAWKEHRINAIRRDVDRLFSILPFEVDFFEGKHHYPVSYVGNPTVDEVARFRDSYRESFPLFAREAGLSDDSPIIALLAGSRAQEIRDNLVRMCRAAAPFVGQGYQLVLAAAPSVPAELYEKELSRLPLEARPKIVYNATYQLLSHSAAALVTSGTATLEAALFAVPQVVCYYVSFGKIVGMLRKCFLKVPYVSLVNLICNREVVPELVADGMTEENIRRELRRIIPGGKGRDVMLLAYREMRDRLGAKGAPARAAEEMIARLKGEDVS